MNSVFRSWSRDLLPRTPPHSFLLDWVLRLLQDLHQAFSSKWNLFHLPKRIVICLLYSPVPLIMSIAHVGSYSVTFHSYVFFGVFSLLVLCIARSWPGSVPQKWCVVADNGVGLKSSCASCQGQCRWPHTIFGQSRKWHHHHSHYLKGLFFEKPQGILQGALGDKVTGSTVRVCWGWNTHMQTSMDENPAGLSLEPV